MYLYKHVSVNVCMLVFMYVCIYVCMYVCVCIHGLSMYTLSYIYRQTYMGLDVTLKHEVTFGLHCVSTCVESCST